MLNFFRNFLEILRAINEEMRNMIDLSNQLHDIMSENEAELVAKLETIMEDVRQQRQRLADSLKETK